MIAYRLVWLSSRTVIFDSFSFYIFFFVSSELPFRVIGWRPGCSSFLSSFFFVRINLEAARISSRTLIFRDPLSTISNCNIFTCLLSILFEISFGISLVRCVLKMYVFVADIEIIVPYFLLQILPKHLFQSSMTGRFSFLLRNMQVYCHEDF